MVAFHHGKVGDDANDAEDRVATPPGPGGGASRDEAAATARFAVADGATQGYDSGRWAGQLVRSFVPGSTHDPTSPGGFDAESRRRWYLAMQERWRTAPTSFATPLAEQTARRKGSMATFVGGMIDRLDTPRPRWSAMAIGDTVLFHVRGDRLVEQFPPMAPDDFGRPPHGLHTDPAAVERMVRNTASRRGAHHLADGDLLFVATDALAEWILRRAADDAGAVWSELRRISHPGRFAQIVEGERERRALANDDTTLLRIRISEAPPAALVVCL